MVNTVDIKRLIIKIATEEGVDPAIALAIAEQESGFNPNARNKSNKEDSIGLYQINRMAHPDYTGGANPEANIRYGLRYFKGQLARAKGNVPLALAAYNGGWEGKNSTQARNYSKQAFNRIGKYANVSNNANKIAINYNDAANPVLKGGVTGMSANLNIPDPERPNYQPYITSQNSVAISNGKGLPPMRLTGDELGAINAITAPIEVPRDVRPDVVIGQDENGKPVTVTASQYNQMLNEMDAQKIQQLNQDLQANLPNLAKAEIQLGGRNAYDTLLGLRDEYNNAIANDPRWDLVRLTPEQAQDAMNILSAKQGAGTSGIVDKAKFYQMMNALQNYQTPMDNAYDLTNQEYLAQLENMKQFQQDALTLAKGNQALAQELMKQATAGNGDVISAIQKTAEARMKQEAEHQKEIQSGFDTMKNTQQQGRNTFYTGLPKLRQDQNQYANTYNLNRYGVDERKYSNDTNVAKDLIMPEIKETAEKPRHDIEFQQKQQELGIKQQNADTNRTNVVMANSGYLGTINPELASNIVGTVPSVNRTFGSPDAQQSTKLFGFNNNVKQTPNLRDYLDLLNGTRGYE